jgi:hypothetical protein
MPFNRMNPEQRRWFDAIRIGLSRDLLSNSWPNRLIGPRVRFRSSPVPETTNDSVPALTVPYIALPTEAPAI